MFEAFCMGGWGMYPTLFFGVLALGAAVRYALDPDRPWLLLIGILSLVDLLAGSLGTITGMIVSMQYAAGLPDQTKLIFLGTSESLHCVALALCLLVVTGMATAAGAFRAASRKGERAGAPAVVTS